MTKVTMAQVNYEQAMDNYYEAQYEGKTPDMLRREAKGYPYNVTEDDIRAMTQDERDALYNALCAILDPQPCGEEWDDAYYVYCTLTNVWDEEYFEENIDAFKAYEARMGEPDFDWGFYSDWHKDMYGFRPRW